MAVRSRQPLTASGVGWAPPGYLCDVLDAACRDSLDIAAFAVLDRELQAEQAGTASIAVLPTLAPIVQRELPAHPFAGRMAGTRRRARLGANASELLVHEVEERAGSGILLGDLGVLRQSGRDPGDRPVRVSLLCYPSLSRRQAHALAQDVAYRSGVDLIRSAWPTLVLHGSRVTIHRSLATGFDFPAFRSQVEASPELTLYDSLARCGLGAPATLWYSDALATRERIDWHDLWAIAHRARWLEPVVQAAAVLRSRDWEVPLLNAQDAAIDRRYWHCTGRRPQRRAWLATRLAVRYLDRR